MHPEVTRIGLLGMQVCVPKEWLDDKVKQFADLSNPCGTINVWQIRKDGDLALVGDPERVACESKDGFVHIMLDA